MKKLFAIFLLLGLVAGSALAAGPADASNSFLDRVARFFHLRASSAPSPPDTRTVSPTSMPSPRQANEETGGTCACHGGGVGTLSIGDDGQWVCSCCEPPPDHHPWEL